MESFQSESGAGTSLEQAMKYCQQLTQLKAAQVGVMRISQLHEESSLLPFFKDLLIKIVWMI